MLILAVITLVCSLSCYGDAQQLGYLILTFTVGSPFSVHCHQVFTCWPVCCCCLFNNLINAMTNNRPNQSLSYYYVLLPWRQFAS